MGLNLNHMCLISPFQGYYTGLKRVGLASYAYDLAPSGLRMLACVQSIGLRPGAG